LTWDVTDVKKKFLKNLFEAKLRAIDQLGDKYSPDKVNVRGPAGLSLNNLVSKCLTEWRPVAFLSQFKNEEGTKGSRKVFPYQVKAEIVGGYTLL